jgi:hypothetical protein
MSEEGDLFAGVPPLKRSTRSRREQPIEIRAARALCQRIKATPARPDKQRIGHLICESLIALCKKNTRGVR